MFRHVVEAGKHHFHVMTSILCSYYHILGGTPHPAIVTVRDDGNYVEAFLYSNYIYHTCVSQSACAYLGFDGLSFLGRGGGGGGGRGRWLDSVACCCWVASRLGIGYTGGICTYIYIYIHMYIYIYIHFPCLCN